MGNVVPFMVTDRILLKRVYRDAEREMAKLKANAEWEYQVTAGFVDPSPPSTDPTVRCLWEMGLIEL
jgi:hypothetical protein